ncbi:MAG TPA: GPP34 family phosphoprotein, partial [Natronosporangium sp.]|nr:GPP34 family phosphoprotein [Natronosporangium sp.]
MRPSLLEELLLIAYSDQGTLVTSVAAVDCGLAGAVLMELMLAGRLTLTKRAVTVVSDEPTGDPLLDEALTRIRTSR